MGGARRGAPSPATRELAEGTRLGEVYMRSLIRTQLRHAVAILVPCGLVLAALPLLFTLVPEVNDVRVFTVPLPWLLLAFAVYPVLLTAAFGHERLADAAERSFTELLGHTEDARLDGPDVTDAGPPSTGSDRVTP